MRKNRAWLIIATIFVALLSACETQTVEPTVTPTFTVEPSYTPIPTATPTPDVINVSEVWEHASKFQGKRIRIIGISDFVVSMTLLKCYPPRCSCNKTWGELRLRDSEAENESYKEYVDLFINPICRGNECRLICTLFVPDDVEYFEILGTINVVYRNEEPSHIMLTDIDFTASRQYVNGKWEPILTGNFIIPIDVDEIFEWDK